MSVVDELLAANAAFVETFSPQPSPVPSRRLAIATCMDARIDVFAALGLELGDAHVIRNAGAVVTRDLVRSLVVSQHRLQTREILVMGHTGCGMEGLDEDAMADELAAATGARPALALGGFADVAESVARSVELIRATPFLPYRDAVRGAVYEVETGRVREVDTGHCDSGVTPA
ncbi:MAG TPA: carbonic anhydrase [Acidimicrobiales bacterium]